MQIVKEIMNEAEEKQRRPSMHVTTCIEFQQKSKTI